MGRMQRLWRFFLPSNFVKIGDGEKNMRNGTDNVRNIHILPIIFRILHTLEILYIYFSILKIFFFTWKYNNIVYPY